MADGPGGVVSRSEGKVLRGKELVRDFRRLGVPVGGLLMVHSSLGSMGSVEGGAETVVDALLEALGPDGTLVAPTFTFPLANDPDFIFDPVDTPSQMGAISESARRRTNAHRSIHARHSVAAIGPLGATIAASGSGSAWEADGPMAQVIHRNGMFMLLGVSYENLTAVHLCEVELGVAYRDTRIAERRIRRDDGAVVPLFSRVHRLVAGEPDPDFNRLGQRMEDAGMVKVGQAGNAVARLFYGSDLRTTARQMYEQDQNAFLKQNGAVTQLTYGHTLATPKGEICVVDPSLVYSDS